MSTIGHESEAVNVGGLKAAIQEYKSTYNTLVTLQAEPSETTLTYTHNGNTYDFKIGDDVRVKDTSAGTQRSNDYVYYRLYDIVTENGVKTAFWDIVGAGSGGGASYTPTLSSEPTESTLTYVKDGKTMPFEIGQFCRVADASAPLGYKFFQLFDIAENGTVAKWNAYATKIPAEYTAPTPKTLTYNTEAQQLLNAGSSDDGTIQYSSDGEIWGTAIPTGTDAGTYNVYWRLSGDAQHQDVPATSIAVTIARKEVASPTVILSEDEYTYDGTAKEPTVTVMDGDDVIPATDYSVSYSSNTNAGTATVTITSGNGNYTFSTSATFTIAKADGSVTTIPTNRGVTYNGNAQTVADAGVGTGTMMYRLGDSGEFSSSIPTLTDAGEYTLYYYAAESENYEQSQTGNITVSVLKAAPTYSAPSAKTLTYNGEGQFLLNAGSSNDGTFQYSLDGAEWSTGLPQGTNAGDYTPQWKLVGDNNHTDIAAVTINVSIAKASPSYSAPSARELTYNGGAQALANAGESSDGTFSYSSDNEEWGSSIPQGTDVGNYTVYWKLMGDENHNDVASTLINVAIGKVTPTVSAPTPKTGLVYNGTAQNLVNAGGTNFGTLQYSLDDDTYSTSIPQGTDATGYNIYYKVVGDENINDVAVQSITASIAKVTPTVSAPTPKVLTFNGSAQALVNAGSADFGTIQYKVGTDSWSTDIPERTKGGSYELSYRVVGDSNINDVAADSVTCSIAEKEITATVELSEDSYVYDGTAKTPSVTVKDGTTVIDPSEYSVTYSNNTNAGTATVTVYDNEGGDYKVIGSATFAITKASGSATAPTAKTLTYSGAAQTLANAGSGTGTMYYSLSEGSGFSTSIPQGTNAGSYIVYYYAAESANYNQSTTGSISVSIGKANGSVTTAPTAKSLTYSGSAQTLANAGSGTGTMYYSLNASSGFSSTIPTGTNAMSYTVYYYAAESSNYKQSATSSISVSIAKADASYTAPTAKSLTYSGSGQALLNAGSVTGGTIQYSADNSTWSTTIPSQTNAGTYTSYWRIVGDSNHNDKASASISTTIAKANQSAPTATGATTTYNTTATATASGGGGQGTLTWTNGNTQTSVGSKTTKAYWAGNTNYNASPYSNEVTLTMNKAAGSVSTAPVNTNYTYNGTARAVASSGSGTGTMYYRLGSSGNFSTTMPTMTNAGSNTLYYYAAASTNYNQSATGSITVTVQKASQNAPTATGASVLEGSTATASASGGGGQGSLEWSNGSTRTALGSQTTKARWTGNGNYNASDWSNEVTLTVVDPYIVDLGLPSGCKWAKGNIVSDGNGGYKVGEETDYGAYFSWGNVTPHFSSNGSTFDDAYDWGMSNTSSPYSGSAGASISYTSQHKGRDYTANTTNDAARACLGGSWQVPTAAQFQELYDNTDNEWTTISGVKGRKFMKKTDHSVYVFFPAAGDGYMTSLYDRGSDGIYWSSSLYDANRGYNLNFNSSSVNTQNGSMRCIGYSVRAVK